MDFFNTLDCYTLASAVWAVERAVIDEGSMRDDQDPGTECLDVSLHRVTETLKGAERKLREHHRALVRVAPDVEEPLGLVAKSPAMLFYLDNWQSAGPNAPLPRGGAKKGARGLNENYSR